MRRFALLALLSLIATPLAFSAADGDKADLKPGLWAEIFDMGEAIEDFPTIPDTRKPTVARADQTIDAEPGQDAWPNTELNEHFFIRWTGVIRIEKEGTYELFLESDDGSRLFVDGKQVLDNNGLHGMDEKSAKVELKPGDHELKIWYFESGGDCGCKFRWKAPGGEKEIVPAKVLFHKAPAAAAAK